ncbi:DUF3750 domain-containing protein [Aestuariispira ectoiniformans]|uniref:DUF3750 domain-containing protein n=1 Tax=Aestuariispira ectoiniformans TaxID=2775080 RepID=UPI00223B1B97|nr:DUF3750 domain-containing protein [Aestuariispira ectoiniformans]
MTWRRILFRPATLFLALAVTVGLTAWGRNVSADWRTANRDSVGIAPDPATTPEPVIQVYGARTYGWRGVFAVHTWIAVKPENASQYTVYHVIGWQVRRGLPAVVIRKDIPDRRWYDAEPVLLKHLQGDGIGAIIDKVDAAARSYPYADRYTAYPGPNSNTFTAWVGRQVPELQLDLPPTAIGKDYMPPDTLADSGISNTGLQVSFLGLLGVTVAREEGLEINIAGLSFGIDPGDLSLRLPLIGTIGPGAEDKREKPAPEPVRVSVESD